MEPELSTDNDRFKGISFIASLCLLHISILIIVIIFIYYKIISTNITIILLTIYLFSLYTIGSLTNRKASAITFGICVLFLFILFIPIASVMCVVNDYNKCTIN